MKIEMKASISSGNLDKIKKKIMASIIKKTPEAFGRVSGVIKDLPAVRNLLSFMNSSQFRADLGITPQDKSEMISDLKDIFTGQNNDYIVKKEDIIFGFLSQDRIREATSAIWTNVNGNRIILVNAWDIYEYGIIGSRPTRGIIDKYVLIKAKTLDQKNRSRSKLALMRYNKNKSFIFAHGEAPEIGSIRASIKSSVKDIKNAIIEAYRS